MSKQTVRSDVPTAYTVEQRMSKAFIIDPGGAGSASIAVQSPDAIDRNLAITLASESTLGAVQSPDAIDRNLSFMTGGDDSPAPHLHLLGSDFQD